MPFTFKLSRRWAGLGAAVASATFLAGACEVRLTAHEIDHVDLVPSIVTVQQQQPADFTVVAFDPAGDTAVVSVTWTATGGTIAGMGSTGGRHHGRYVNDGCGAFRVIATTEPGSRADSAEVTVTCPATVPVASVEVTPASGTVDELATLHLTGTTRDAAGAVLPGRIIAWTTSDSAIATVSGSGRVTGRTVGSAAITATSEGKDGSSSITVRRVPVASVEVTPASATVEEQRTIQLGATPRAANGTPLAGRPIAWTSDDETVATVSDAGLVTAKVLGSATITATSEGRRGTSAITVIAPPPPASAVVLVGAGDIANCGTSTDEATARLLDTIAGTVFTAGDNVYTDGTAAEFLACYEPTWGRHKARTRPVPGNHDYNTSGAAPYYAYYGLNAGPPGRGYYSYDLGEWHIIALNSEVSASAGSAQEQWLRADLAANTKRCTLAIWHKPLFSSGYHGSLSGTKPLWAALYAYDADVVLVGHDHNYERFAPQTADGVADAARGLRQFVVGTGGTSLRGIGTPITNSEVRNSVAHGVLKLTLRADGYDWEFVPVAGQTFTDRGSDSCH